MSQHSGGRSARHLTPDKPGRPSLERPSLFAGMDNEPSSFDGDTQRVRILSTLESTRRPARGPMKIHGITKKKRSNWQAKALLGLMAVGVLSLLASFVMVLVNGHAPSARPDATDQAVQPSHPTTSAKPAAAPRTSTDNPLAALIAPAAPPVRADADTTTRPAQAAVIENVAIPAPMVNKGSSALAKMSTEAKTSPAQPAAPKPSAITTTATAKAEPAKPTVVALAAPTSQASPQATGAAQDASKQAKPAAPTGKRAQAGGRNDEDVALLEAMFAHTRPRPATESAADEIKRRCTGLSGPDAATCRARVCVQNPTAAVCHQD